MTMTKNRRPTVALITIVAGLIIVLTWLHIRRQAPDRPGADQTAKTAPSLQPDHVSALSSAHEPSEEIVKRHWTMSTPSRMRWC